MAKKGKKKVFQSRLFLVLVPLFFVWGVLVLVVSGQRFLAQRPCGCGPFSGEISGEFDSGEKEAYWENRAVEYPFSLLASLPRLEGDVRVLGESDDYRWIEVDLSDQKLYAHEGDRIVYEFLVSSGKPWTPTLSGDFRIWLKLRYAKMSGGSREAGNYYYLPNVPFIQYYSGDYGLHGAYWHNNFGNTMSHGCVNLAIPDAEKLFVWTRPVVPAGRNAVRASASQPGTRVIVHP